MNQEQQQKIARHVESIRQALAMAIALNELRRIGGNVDKATEQRLARAVMASIDDTTPGGYASRPPTPWRALLTVWAFLFASVGIGWLWRLAG